MTYDKNLYDFFFLAYSPSALKPGITSLKSLLYHGDIGKSQATSIMYAVVLIDTNVQVHHSQVYAHTHIQYD